MKANATTENRRGSTNGNDIVQNAINLGVKVQQINIFLKESNKYVNYLKKVVIKTKNDIDGCIFNFDAAFVFFIILCPHQWSDSINIIFCLFHNFLQIIYIFV
jgi:hypothetical protein